MRRARAILCLLGLAWSSALPSPASAQSAAQAGGEAADRLSRIEQVMWSRDSAAAATLREWAAADPSDRVRERSVGALAVLGDSGAGKVITDRLSRDPSPRVRRAAAEAVGVLRLRVLPWELTEPLAKDSDASVRGECARAVGLARVSEGSTALLGRLASDPSPEVRALSAEALARLRFPDAVPLLLQAVLTDRSPLVQLYVVRALAEFNTPPAVALFQELVPTTRDAELRFELYRGLLRSSASRQWTVAGMSDGDDRVRFLAFREWLRQIPPPEENRLPRRSTVILKMESFLSDSAPGIRSLARAALHDYGYRTRSSGLVDVIDE